ARPVASQIVIVAALLALRQGATTPPLRPVIKPAHFRPEIARPCLLARSTSSNWAEICNSRRLSECGCPNPSFRDMPRNPAIRRAWPAGDVHSHEVQRMTVGPPELALQP